MADIAAGHYETGIDELKKAYDILPHPNVLYNIARAYADMGDLDNAVVYFRRYLESNPKDRDDVAQIVVALETRIRKQQAQLLEAQQAQTNTVQPAGPTAPSVPGEPPATVNQPPAVAAEAKPTVGGKVAPPEPSLPPGALKTEEVFEETVVTASRTAQSPLDAPNSTSIITEQDVRLSGITKTPELLRRLAGVDIMETTGSQTNQCQQYDVYGAEIGARVFPVEGLDFYANTTLMDVRQDNKGCSAAQLSLIVNDARTSAVKINTGVQVRTKIGVDASVDVHFVSAQTWAEQVVSLQRQAIVYESFHLDPYTLVNASVGYRFLGGHADARAVAFNLFDDQHREHPFGQVLDRRLMGLFSYKF